MVGVKETLEITNFLSIKKANWHITDFNILTGEMATGKSLCLKLLKFFEDIIPDILSSSYNRFVKWLDIKNLFSDLSENFTTLFSLERTDDLKPQFNIVFTVEGENDIFKMTVSGTNKNDIVIKCDFLKNLLPEWKRKMSQDKYLSLDNIYSTSRFSELKQIFSHELLEKFNFYFPSKTIFIPASRAAILSSSHITDSYLKSFNYLLKFLPMYRDTQLNIKDEITAILKGNIKIKEENYYLESDDGRSVHLDKGSSGQQEIATFLLLLNKIGQFGYSSCRDIAITIEEMSAHIFPADQKKLIELIVRIYRHFKISIRPKTPIRFFMTIHSPLVLDCLNNMFRTWELIRNHTGNRNIIEREIRIPPLNPEEVSAIFMNSEGKMENLMIKSRKILKLNVHKLTYVYDDVKKDAKTIKMLSESLNKLSPADTKKP